MKKLIFVNRYFWPDHSATAQILSDLVFDLAQENFAINVITSRQRYDDASANLVAKETVQTVQIFRVGNSKFGRTRLWGRLFDYLNFFLLAARQIRAIAMPGDIVIMKTDPPMLGTLMHPFMPKNLHLIHWWQDVFPEVAAKLNVIKEYGVVEKTLKWLRAKVLKRVDMVVVVGHGMRERAIAAGATADQVQVISNWADTSALTEVLHANNMFRKKFYADTHFVVGYSGNFGRAHEFDGLLAAMQRLQADIRIHLLLIGGGAQHDVLLGQIAQMGLHERVRVMPYQAREKLSESLSAIDLHVVSLRPELEGLIVPSKLYGALSVGRPVLFLGSKNGEVANIVNSAQCGVQCEANDSIAIANAIQRYADEIDYWRSQSEQARVEVARCGNRVSSVRAWRNLILQVFQSSENSTMDKQKQ